MVYKPLLAAVMALASASFTHGAAVFRDLDSTNLTTTFPDDTFSSTNEISIQKREDDDDEEVFAADEEIDFYDDNDENSYPSHSEFYDGEMYNHNEDDDRFDEQFDDDYISANFEDGDYDEIQSSRNDEDEVHYGRRPSGRDRLHSRRYRNRDKNSNSDVYFSDTDCDDADNDIEHHYQYDDCDIVKRSLRERVGSRISALKREDEEEDYD